jgi:hypothetical protein
MMNLLPNTSATCPLTAAGVHSDIDAIAEGCRTKLACRGMPPATRRAPAPTMRAGLPDDKLPEALLPGRRLDESVPGYGFGLPITRELAELYGGSLSLSRSGLGGLKAELRLPRGGALAASA